MSRVRFHIQLQEKKDDQDQSVSDRSDFGRITACRFRDNAVYAKWQPQRTSYRVALFFRQYYYILFLVQFYSGDIISDF